VLSAKLRLFASNGSTNGPAVYGTATDWSETVITWNTGRPARTSGNADDKAGITTGTWVEYDVTSLVPGDGPVSFNVAPTSSDGTDFHSREAATNLPQLVVTTTAREVTPPVTSITSGPSGVVRSSSVTYEFASSEPGSTFECALDAAPLESCVSPKTYSGLDWGEHRFAVRAIDAAGNVDATPATRTFQTDLGYPRPQAGVRLRVPLVVAYRACATPDRAHQGGLQAGSCSSPQPESGFLTIADPNGASRSSGMMRFDVKPGTPSIPEDDADVDITVNLTDVRQRADFADYAGELQGHVMLQPTDRNNGLSNQESATVEALPFAFTVPCTATPGDPSAGSTCSVTTTMDSVTPGTVVEGKRSNSELGKLKLFDGGSDGLAATTGDNTLFETQGVFVP
jgi:hypothetical protein